MSLLERTTFFVECFPNFPKATAPQQVKFEGKHPAIIIFKPSNFNVNLCLVSNKKYPNPFSQEKPLKTTDTGNLKKIWLIKTWALLYQISVLQCIDSHMKPFNLNIKITGMVADRVSQNNFCFKERNKFDFYLTLTFLII